MGRPRWVRGTRGGGELVKVLLWIGLAVIAWHIASGDVGIVEKPEAR
jgi:hypothetical protein